MAIVLGEEGYGETTVSAIYLGSSAVTKVYLGANAVYTASGGGGGGSSYAITLFSDGSSSTYQEYAVIDLEALPTGATGYKIEITGTESSAFTGVVLAVLSPTDNGSYYVNTQANISNNPSDDGPQNKNMRAVFTAESGSSTVNRVKIYAHNGNGATNVTVKVTPINNSYADVGSASNTLTGITIDEDG